MLAMLHKWLNYNYTYIPRKCFEPLPGRGHNVTSYFIIMVLFHLSQKVEFLQLATLPSCLKQVSDLENITISVFIMSSNEQKLFLEP